MKKCLQLKEFESWGQEVKMPAAERYFVFWRCWVTAFIVFVTFTVGASGCQFYPSGEYLKFVRLPENLPRGHEVLTLEVHPRKHLAIKPVDKERDARYFSYKELNRTHVAIVLTESLANLEDAEMSRNLLKFRVTCDGTVVGNSQVSSQLSVTVYVEDVNNHSPEFVDAPYHVTIEELTPVGRTIFRGIRAIDKDKRNTPNSDVHYAIIRGNEEGKFSLNSGPKAELVLRKMIDYDAGDREYTLTIMASDRGIPTKSSNTTVTVLVADNDDLNPKFTRDVYRTRIYEFYPMVHQPIHLELNFTPPIIAVDQDREINARIRYDLTAGNERSFFYLDPDNGSLFLEKGIDLDGEHNLPENTFTLQIQASQTDNPLRTSTARVEVEVLDLNDNLPEFEIDPYNISIVENLPNGFSVLQVIAVDKDQGENGDFDYELEDYSGAFAIEPKSGWLIVRDQTRLDREQQNSLKMKVFAREKLPSVVKGSNNSSVVEVEVNLLDANDNNPKFVPNNLYEFLIEKDAPAGTEVGRVKAVDSDLGRNGMVLYNLQKTGNSSVHTPFKVDSHTGVISVVESPIIEGRHAIFVEAVDQPANPSERRFSLAVVTVEVFRSDKHNLGEPDFIGAPYEFWVGANVGIGTSVGQIRINEDVIKENVIYDLLHSYYEGVPFAVEERSGTITVIDEIEKYDRSLYDFEAQVTDERDLMMVTNVSIHVVDPSDERGIFTQSTTKVPLVFHVKENIPGAFIGQILPHNGTNSTRNIRFFIANHQDVLDIDITEEGALYTPNGLDRELRENYSITVIADNVRGVGIFQVMVIVDDENDNAPIFEFPIYEGLVQENSPVGTEVTLNRRVKARDLDEGGSQNFAITLHGEGSELFTIDQVHGRVFFKGNSQDLLDREVIPSYNLSLVATDKGNLHSEAQLIVTVTDENDNAPNFTQMLIQPDQGIAEARYSQQDILREGYSSGNPGGFDKEHISANDNVEVPLLTIPENVTLGIPIIRMVASDKDEGENGEVSYAIVKETYAENRYHAILKPHFLINSVTGDISVSQMLPASREIILSLIAVDGGGLHDNITLRFYVKDVNDHAPVFKKSWYLFNVPEGSYEDRLIGTIEAVDSDHGRNANISYGLMKTARQSVPFAISEYTGVLKVTGELDRESLDMYEFNVIATDHGTERLTSTVLVQVNVLDVNDNAPIFWGYDDNSEYIENGVDQYPGPVYQSSIAGNSPVGTIVAKVYANDSDLIGNGNGLILFDIPHRREENQYFTIDSKEGLVTTIAKFDFETHGLHNLTITASDLGSPSLTSTAMLIVNVVDVEDGNDLQKPVFQHRYYEVEVQENSPVPLKLVQLNVSDSFHSHHIRYTLVSTDLEVKTCFSIDAQNGTLYLVKPLDREIRDFYEIKVRVDRVKNGRALPVMIYAVLEDKLNGLEFNEAKIIVKVKDANDNVPRFKSNGRPMLAAIPTTAHYGYEIIKVEAEDLDEGINGDIRYQILGREDAPRFAIDPLSGQVRSVGSFSRDAGRVFGFDVKATDRAGAEDGRSSIANVFVYVLDDHKQVVMVMGDRPTDIEKQIENIISVLHNVTGLDVRVRKLEPHIEKNLIDAGSTDMYLYAVDPHLNVMIDMDTLHNVFHNKKTEIKRELEKYHVLDIAGNTPRRSNQRYLLSTLEVGVVVLGCIVFVGALVTVLCITCVRRNKRRQQQEAAIFAAGTPVGFALADPNGSLQKPGMFPTFVDGLHYEPESFERDVRQHGLYEHEPNCVRFHRSNNGKHIGRTVPAGLSNLQGMTGMEASAASLHSSGQDSGIVARTCHCSHSSSPSSGESSNGYEDSLKSLHRRSNSSNEISHGQELSTSTSRRANLPSSRRRQRFHSFATATGPLSSGANFTTENAFKRSKRRLDPDSLVSDTENNLTDTIIHEHPSTEGLIPAAPLMNPSTLHGKSQNVIISTPAVAALTKRQNERFNVMYARPR